MNINEVRKWFDDHVQRSAYSPNFLVDNIELVDNKIVINNYNRGDFALTEPWPDDWEFGEWIGEYEFLLRAPKFTFKSFPSSAYITIYGYGCIELELPKCSIMSFTIEAPNLTILKAEPVKCRKITLNDCPQLDIKSILPTPIDVANLPMDYAIKMVKAGKKPFNLPHCSININ